MTGVIKSRGVLVLLLLGCFSFIFLFAASYIQADQVEDENLRRWQNNGITTDVYQTAVHAAESEPLTIKTAIPASLKTYDLGDKVLWGLNFISNPEKAKRREIFYAYDVKELSAEYLNWVTAINSPEWEKSKEANPLYFGWAVAASHDNAPPDELIALPLKWNRNSATVLRNAAISHKVDDLQVYFGEKLNEKLGVFYPDLDQDSAYLVTNIPWEGLELSVKPTVFVGNTISWDISDDLPYEELANAKVNALLKSAKP